MHHKKGDSKDEKEDYVQAVTLVMTGKAGTFNRFQRAYFNTLEYLALVVFSFLMFGYLFPKLSFYFLAAFCGGRFLYAVGYGAGFSYRSFGFLISNVSMGLLMMSIVYVSLVSSNAVPLEILFPFGLN